MKRLSPAEMADYERVLADDRTGAEQTAMRGVDPQAYDAWLAAQLAPVPMPSEQKPEINGFREGDRVRLTQPFHGETCSYEAGRTGTFVVTNTAPTQIRLARKGFYEVVTDPPQMGLIMAMPGYIEKIPGHAEVQYSNDGNLSSVRVTS